MEATAAKNVARPREVGEVRKRHDRPGYRVRITWEGTTIERAAGTTWPAAESKRRAREVYLTAPECRALLAACSPVLRSVVLAALHTGMRRGELLALAWRSVDLDRGELVVQPETEKPGRGRTIPLTPDLLACLQALRTARMAPRIDGTDPVFTLTDGTPFPLATLRALWEPTVQACAGIDASKRHQVTFHTLRHTAASLMVGAGAPILDVARILGHSTLAVTMRYAHHAPESGRSAIDRLGDALALRPAGARKAAAG